MYKKMIASLMICVTLIVSIFSGIAVASEEKCYINGEEVLVIGVQDGMSNSGVQPAGLVFDVLLPNFVCDQRSRVIFTFNNLLSDPVDIVQITIKTPSLEKTIEFYNIPSGETGAAYPVVVPMKAVHEKLLITYRVIDSGDTYGESQQSGHRDVPATWVSQWAPGSKNDPELNLTYHFEKHCTEVGVDNILDYCDKAIKLRNSLTASEYVRDVGGATPNTKRYERNDYYICVSGDRNTGLIVMYGKIIRA